MTQNQGYIEGVARLAHYNADFRRALYEQVRHRTHSPSLERLPRLMQSNLSLRSKAGYMTASDKLTSSSTCSSAACEQQTTRSSWPG